MYCSSLGRACGIASYTKLLVEAQGLPAVSSVSELEKIDCTHVHVQHEFGIMSLAELQRVHHFCMRNNLHFFVTMHTVMPLLSLFGYYRYRLKKMHLRKLLVYFFLTKILLTDFWLKPFERVIASVNVLLRGNLRLWKRWLPLKQFLHNLPEIRHPPISDGLLYWMDDRPDLDLKTYRFFRSSQRFIIRFADSIVVHLPIAKDVLESQGAHRVEVIPHGIKSFPVSGALNSAKDGKLHIGCFGHLQPARGLLAIIEACAEIPDIRLHIFASDKINKQTSAYLSVVKSAMRGKHWIDFCTDHLPLEEIVFRLSQCDLNISYCDPPGGISASGSICQYIAAQRPIIASDTVMVSDLHDCLTIIAPNNPQSLAAAIRRLQKTEDSVRVMRTHLKNRAFVKARPLYLDLAVRPEETDRMAVDKKGGILRWIARHTWAVLCLPRSFQRIANAADKILQIEEAMSVRVNNLEEHTQQITSRLIELQKQSSVAIDRLHDIATASGGIAYRMNDIVAGLHLIADLSAQEADREESAQKPARREVALR